MANPAPEPHARLVSVPTTLTQLSDGGDTPILKLEITNSSELRAGYVTAYFPQPLQTQEVLRAFTEVGRHTMNSACLNVPVPSDRVNNHLRFQFFELEDIPGQIFTRRMVLQRQASGQLLQAAKFCSLYKQVEVHLYHINVAHSTQAEAEVAPHATLKLRCTSKPWSDDSAAFIHWLFGEAPHRASFYTTREAAVVRRYLENAQTYLDDVKHANVGLQPWLVCAEGFQDGKLPLWSMLLEYAHPIIRPGTEETLIRMAQVCHAKAGMPEQISRMRTSDWCELLCDVMAMLPLCTTYAPDRRRCFKRAIKQVPSTGEEPFTFKHRHLRTYKNGMDATTHGLVPEDQWVHSLVCPHYSSHGYDCEDGACTAYYVFHLIQSLNPDNVQDRWLHVLCLLARRYVCTLAVGTLVLPGKPARLTYHAYPVLIDAALMDQRLARDLGTTTKVVPPSKGSTDMFHPRTTRDSMYTGLPTMFVETTESTTACMDFTGGIDAATFFKTRVHCSLVHTKIPTSEMNPGSQYPHILLLQCPQLYARYGVVELALENRDGELGVQSKHLLEPSTFGTSSEWRVRKPADITDEMYTAVTQAVVQMPRTPGLPAAPPPSEQQPLPFLAAGKHRVLMFTNARYRVDVLPLIVSAAHKAGHRTEVYEGVEILEGIVLSYVIVDTN